MFGILYTNDIFNTYVFIEILSITTCAIISIKKKKDTYTSAFRYLMMNELGSLSYLIGVALIYMATGYTNITLIGESMSNAFQAYQLNIVIALGFMIIGLGIKAAVFPFHIGCRMLIPVRLQLQARFFQRLSSKSYIGFCQSFVPVFMLKF
jgi:multicomponent Na+:H+ antiporter subunit D